MTSPSSADNNIPVRGRGSAAKLRGLLLRPWGDSRRPGGNGLLFERFLSRPALGRPDIDVDIEVRTFVSRSSSTSTTSYRARLRRPVPT